MFRKSSRFSAHGLEAGSESEIERGRLSSHDAGLLSPTADRARQERRDDPGLDRVLAEQATNGLERPSEVYVDGAYVSGARLHQAREEHWQLMGPAQPSANRAGIPKAYRIEAFDIDIAQRQARCPGAYFNTQCSRLEEQKRNKVSYRREWSVVACVEDIGSAAKKRPQREEFIKLAKRRQLDVIIVWRLDRWGRSLIDLMESLRDLTALGVGFVSITEALDLTTPTGRAMTGMIAVFAEFERDILRERVRAGMAKARKNGKAIGRPATARAKADRIRELFDQGLNKQQIAEQLRIGRASVFRALAA
jgi:putative DNA-invertase from lambdoid prophage Rac